jgi:hypothetical protein
VPEVDVVNSGNTNNLRLDVMLLISIALNILMAVELRIFGSQMYPFFITVYIWIAVYVLFLVVILQRERFSGSALIRDWRSLLGISILTLLIRSVFIGMTEVISLDSLWYLDFGTFMTSGSLPYTDFYFPYPPFFAYVIFTISSIAPSVDAFRVFAMLMDVAVVIVLWKLVKRHVGEYWASTAALAYSLLPVSVIESGWNGHFEPLANLFLLICLWFLMEENFNVSGFFLGLAGATKIYPLIVFPILFFYCKGKRRKFEFTLSTGLTFIALFMPFFMTAWLIGGAGPVNISQVVPPAGIFHSLFGFLLNPKFPSIIISLFAIGAIGIGTILMIRQTLRNDPRTNARVYYIFTIGLGIVLVVMGITSGLYPLLPMSRFVYWRYPVDVGIVRGVTAICVGILVMTVARREWLQGLKRQVSLNALLVLVGATFMLLLAMSREVFYGWYLLWSIPLFLLMRDRRLGFTVILCFLLVYPSYTHDNFSNLGFEEERIWSEEFIDVSDWSQIINTSLSTVNASLISAGVTTHEDSGCFRFDTSRIRNESNLENVSISFSKQVDIDFESTTEFAARVIVGWDPTFGRYADISLSYKGHNGTGEPIAGYIIPRTGLFTNLTYILWRYAFQNLGLNATDGTLEELTLTLYPALPVTSECCVDFFYTTYAGPLNPVYFLIIPSLIALALAAFTLLHSEFERHKNKTSKIIYSKKYE